jgi:hypothetical protein
MIVDMHMGHILAFVRIGCLCRGLNMLRLELVWFLCLLPLFDGSLPSDYLSLPYSHHIPKISDGMVQCSLLWWSSPSLLNAAVLVLACRVRA